MDWRFAEIDERFIALATRLDSHATKDDFESLAVMAQKEFASLSDSSRASAFASATESCDTVEISSRNSCLSRLARASRSCALRRSIRRVRSRVRRAWGLLISLSHWGPTRRWMHSPIAYAVTDSRYSTGRAARMTATARACHLVRKGTA